MPPLKEYIVIMDDGTWGECTLDEFDDFASAMAFKDKEDWEHMEMRKTSPDMPDYPLAVYKRCNQNA